MSIDPVRAFQFSFEDNSWVAKFAITIVLAIIPFVGWFIIAGYMLRVTRNIIFGIETLPEYDDWGGDLTRGFIAAVGGFTFCQSL